MLEKANQSYFFMEDLEVNTAFSSLYGSTSRKIPTSFYDQTGCGESEAPKNNQYSMRDEVANLEALRVQLGFEKINILGESWGSMLALLYATTYPEQ